MVMEAREMAAGGLPGAVDLGVEIGVNAKLPLRLRNPVIAASGTFGYGTEYARLVDIQRLGAICSKSVTARPRRGNRGTRMVDTPAGMLNAVGLQNIGVRRLIAEKAPVWAEWDVPVIVSIAGDNLDEVAYLAERLDAVPGVSGLEINLACPNVWENGRVIGEDADTAAAITGAVRQRTGLPVLVKLSPHVSDMLSVARAVEDAGADGISLVNTFVGMRIDTHTGRPVLGNVSGGLSGPAILPLALWIVFNVSAAVTIPVIGLGGISSTEDALEFLMAGAAAVQVGTMTFVEPRTAPRIVDELPRAIAARGYSSVSELSGLTHRVGGKQWSKR